MKVNFEFCLNNSLVDPQSKNTQRQLAIEISAIGDQQESQIPLNLCLVLECSSSMTEGSLAKIKQAVISLIEQLDSNDRISVVAFNHQATTIVPNQTLNNKAQIKQQINRLAAHGGTAIDEGLKLGIREVAVGKRDAVSHILLLSHGENEQGDNKRCIKLAQLASQYKITVNTLGLGANWNQDVLESIADVASGTITYIEQPEQAIAEFDKLLNRIKSVGLTDARLILELFSSARLARLKPIAQVSPETVELNLIPEGNYYTVRLGDITRDLKRTILINLYIDRLTPGKHQIAAMQLTYDAPATKEANLHSAIVSVEVEATETYQSQSNYQVQKSVLTLAKYRQTKIAEANLKQGDTESAATMLNSAAKTALQLGDRAGAIVLQQNAALLQQGTALTEIAKKKIRLVSKIMQ